MNPLNLPPSVLDELPALLKEKPKRSYNPFVYIWIAMEHIAYWFAPANNCQYCWVWRMWLFGFIVGVELFYWFPWIKFW